MFWHTAHWFHYGVKSGPSRICITRITQQPSDKLFFFVFNNSKLFCFSKGSSSCSSHKSISSSWRLLLEGLYILLLFLLDYQLHVGLPSVNADHASAHVYAGLIKSFWGRLTVSNTCKSFLSLHVIYVYLRQGFAKWSISTSRGRWDCSRGQWMYIYLTIITI